MTQLPYSLEVHDLTVAYGAKPVLWDIDLALPRAQLIAIVGPNGAGKSTLLKSLVGLIQPLSGGVHFHDMEIKNGKFANKVAYVPQSSSVDWDFPATVLDVAIMGRYGHLGWFRRPGAQDRDLALKTLAQVGMQEYASRQISQLSGGQQQRVFLARALLQDAELYLMDEPFKGVDAQTERSIVSLLKGLKDQGKTVVVVHHDLQTVSEYFDWVTLINQRIIANGTVAETFTEENLSLAYGNRGLLKPGAAS